MNYKEIPVFVVACNTVISFGIQDRFSLLKDNTKTEEE